MNLDIVLEWMKTYQGKITKSAIRRKFGITRCAANRIYDMLVRGGHVFDENRKARLLLESQREAAHEMYELLNEICSKIFDGTVKNEDARKIENLLKKARGEQ